MQRSAQGERGQALIITVGAMFALLAFAAIAIDASNWYRARHSAQVAADSAALAAANCLANASTGEACTSTTDTADAQQMATTYARDNGLTIPAGDVTVSSSDVTVNSPVSAPSLFAGIAKLASATVNPVVAVATFTEGSTVCTAAAEAAGACYAIYAANQTCGSNNGFVSNSTSETITGGVHSQGSMNISNGSFKFNSPITYSSGNCPYMAQRNATMLGTYRPLPGGNQAASYWPMDYSTVFTSCSGASCTGPNGTPSYCGAAAANYTFDWSSHPTGIYCAYGTGTPGDPATWNGKIAFSNGPNIGSSSNYVGLTLIAGSISVSAGNVFIKAAPGADGCVLYALETDSQAGGTAIWVGNGNYGWDGEFFAPNGTVSVNSSSSTGTFIEARNVDLVNFSFTGDGPIDPASGVLTHGSDRLIR